MLQQSWRPRLQAQPQALPRPLLLRFSIPAVRQDFPQPSLTVASIEEGGGEGDLSTRERRHLRNERRESRAAAAGSWREEVEERLTVKPKKKYTSSTEKLNLDTLALLGPNWWLVRVRQANCHETADRFARAFAMKYPDREFKMYIPAVKVKRKLKNGTISIKPRLIIPGSLFLYCILNKEIHDFIRECDGIGGFLGSTVRNNKREIYRPKPVAADELEAILKQAQEEQELADQEFEKYQAKESSNEDFEAQSSSGSSTKTNYVSPTKQKRKSRKSIERENLLGGYDSLVPGSSVRVLSGSFTDYTGYLKEVNRKTGKATVGLMLFGKESFVELEVNQIAAGE